MFLRHSLLPYILQACGEMMLHLHGKLGEVMRIEEIVDFRNAANPAFAKKFIAKDIVIDGEITRYGKIGIVHDDIRAIRDFQRLFGRDEE